MKDPFSMKLGVEISRSLECGRILHRLSFLNVMLNVMKIPFHDVRSFQ